MSLHKYVYVLAIIIFMKQIDCELMNQRHDWIGVFCPTVQNAQVFTFHCSRQEHVSVEHLQLGPHLQLSPGQPNTYTDSNYPCSLQHTCNLGHSSESEKKKQVVMSWKMCYLPACGYKDPLQHTGRPHASSVRSWPAKYKKHCSETKGLATE